MKNKIIESVLKESMIEQVDKDLQPIMKKFWNTFGTGNITLGSCIGHNEPNTFRHFYIQMNNKEIEGKPLLQFFLTSVFKKPNIKEQQKSGNVTISTEHFREDGTLVKGTEEEVRKANKLAFEDFKNALDEYAKTNVLKESSATFDSPFWEYLIHTTSEEDKKSIMQHGFRENTNPNILPGIYTQPNVWFTPMSKGSQIIKIYTLDSAKVYDNDADRPLDTVLNRNTSEDYSNFYKGVLKKLGESENSMRIGNDFEARKFWRNEYLKFLKDKNIDIVVNGGEVIILNKNVITKMI